MAAVIGIPASGEMGAGLAKVLTKHGARVLTNLEGRSAASRGRAADAGMEHAGWEAIARADMILSIVPPGIALDIARRLAAHFPPGAAPFYADLNAIHPALTREIGATVTAAGAQFADGAIIGPPPSDGKQPRIYVSGDAAAQLLPLCDLGLDIRAVDGGIGAASALKMCYGGITKGLTGLMAAMMLAAEREGAGAALHAELSGSQAALLKRAGNATPEMYSKAYRWVAEMESISEFIGSDRPEHMIWQGIAGLYQRIAADNDGPRREIAEMDRFLARSQDG
ncbi:NAD(P)-dependent oxidoreductase [Alkalilacustris brevis]|uniref:NAD(P)-dependent oxidoreductase n=1 Tax=Alkalilacustris brevis TaxID=2026338 RepID=UPI000E0D5121|nr:NAD(P)-dependent oxidoreductase [Alkalilacustris brevis]